MHSKIGDVTLVVITILTSTNFWSDAYEWFHLYLVPAFQMRFRDFNKNTTLHGISVRIVASVMASRGPFY